VFFVLNSGIHGKGDPNRRILPVRQRRKGTKIGEDSIKDEKEKKDEDRYIYGDVRTAVCCAEMGVNCDMDVNATLKRGDAPLHARMCGGGCR